jgi:hypothetical protein
VYFFDLNRESASNNLGSALLSKAVKMGNNKNNKNLYFI